MNAELRRKQEFAKPIEIGSDVWVGGGAIICPGVKIGSKTVIGAGSVVTRDIPDGVFAAGIRAGSSGRSRKRMLTRQRCRYRPEVSDEDRRLP